MWKCGRSGARKSAKLAMKWSEERPVAVAASAGSELGGLRCSALGSHRIQQASKTDQPYEMLGSGTAGAPDWLEPLFPDIGPWHVESKLQNICAQSCCLPHLFARSETYMTSTDKMGPTATYSAWTSAMTSKHLSDGHVTWFSIPKSAGQPHPFIVWISKSSILLHVACSKMPLTLETMSNLISHRQEHKLCTTNRRSL
jgi:hypothetical protein